ncbi:hypothetical protein MRB53_030581 [Persea americana]|uniref:Uncharacterized protein n=1 Tax=Persea americana TaxID=3435 RepID=A0ACC2KMP7_PERAE|nr:hypothetical protein MRB53_030581 [Persea americana]
MTHVEGSFLSQFVVSVEEPWFAKACEVAVDDEIPELAKVALSMDRPKNERCSPGIVGPPMPNIKQALSRTTQATTKCSNRSAWSSKFILAPKLNQTTTPKSAFYFCPIYCPTAAAASFATSTKATFHAVVSSSDSLLDGPNLGFPPPLQLQSQSVYRD